MVDFESISKWTFLKCVVVKIILFPNFPFLLPNINCGYIDLHLNWFSIHTRSFIFSCCLGWLNWVWSARQAFIYQLTPQQSTHACIQPPKTLHFHCIVNYIWQISFCACCVAPKPLYRIVKLVGKIYWVQSANVRVTLVNHVFRFNGISSTYSGHFAPYWCLWALTKCLQTIGCYIYFLKGLTKSFPADQKKGLPSYVPTYLPSLLPREHP